MRKLRFLPLLALLFFCDSVSAGYTRVQRVSAVGHTGVAFSVAIAAPTAGDLLVVEQGWITASCASLSSAPTDNKGGGSSTYTTDLAPNNFINNECIAVYSTANISSSVTSVTINSTAFQTLVVIEEWSGAGTSAPFDKSTAANDTAGGGAWNSGTTATLTGSTDLAIGIAFQVSNGTMTNTPGSGFGDGGAELDNSFCGCGLYSQNKTLAANTGLAATGTLSAAPTNIGGGIVTYKAGISGPSGAGFGGMAGIGGKAGTGK